MPKTWDKPGENTFSHLFPTTPKKKLVLDEKNPTLLQFGRFNDICEEHCMIQIIEEATREENTLELVYTNDIRIVANIDVNTSAISDHNKIEISTTYRIKE